MPGGSFRAALEYISLDLYSGLGQTAGVNAFDVLGDPVRREILRLLAYGERAAGEVVEAIGDRFQISQPAVSQHLKVLREHGLVTVRAEGTRRFYAVNPAPLREIDDWLGAFRQFWQPKLDALETEIARGKRQRRLEIADAPPEERKTSA
jgi:DNA-binding transcriptional ArsR family regulator